MDFLYLVLFYFLLFLVRLLPQSMLDFLAKNIGKLAFRINKKHRKIILANLKLCFPSKDEAWHIKTCKKVYINYAFYAFDFLSNFKATKEEILAKVSFINAEVILAAKQEKKGILLSSAHFSNWELLGLAVGANFGQISSVGRKLDQPKINKLLYESRQRFNASIIEKTKAAKELLNILKKGGMAAILCDQDAIDAESIKLKLFSKEVNFIKAASILGKRANSLLIPTYIYFVKDHYEVYFFKALDCSKYESSELSSYQARCLEEMISKYPDQYFFFHKRFKRYHNEIYE